MNHAGDLLDPPGESVDPVRSHHITWRVVFLGAVVAAAMWILLMLLGLAIGLTAVDVDNAGSISGAAISTGIWSLIAPLIAFGVGGLVVGRAMHASSKLDHAIGGLVMWSVGMIGGTIMLGMFLSSIVGGAMSAGKAAVGAVGDAAGQAASGLASNAGRIDDVAHSFGIDANDVMQPVNQRLRREGKPQITAAQVEAAAKDVVGDAVRTGSFDRELLVKSIADKTALSQADAEDIASRIQAQYERTKSNVGAKLNEVKDDAKHAALTAADATGKAMLGLFGAMVLALLATIGGALLGSRRHHVTVRSRTVATR